MKRAYFNCILLDGTEQMEPVAHKMVLVDGEKITAIVEDTAPCEGYGIGHTNIPQTADLEKACRKAFGKPPLLVFELGGVVSANTGPDTVALVYTGHPRG